MEIILLLLVIGGILLYWFLANYLTKSPISVTGISHQIKGVSMRVAEVKVFWGLSVSPDVVAQTAIVTSVHNGDSTETVYELAPTVSELVFNVPENTQVSLGVVVSDGLFESDVVTYSFQVGDLSKPQPVSFVGHEILRVYDSE